jgi:hypothetical protein
MNLIGRVYRNIMLTNENTFEVIGQNDSFVKIKYENGNEHIISINTFTYNKSIGTFTLVRY